jgi:uncharacterized glyoxalase superfamily protein PhnB
VQCYCCGEERDPDTVASLACHDEVKVCRVCIGWLMQRAGGVDVTPTLPVVDMDEATDFYVRAGFQIERYNDEFAFVTVDDQSVFDLDLAAGMEPATNHAGCYVITRDTDAWHARLSASGLPVTDVQDMPWGMHEFTLTDPSGNQVRIGRSTSGA